MRRHGADVRAFGVEPDQLEPAAASGPERVAVAGGDGTLGTAAALAGRLGVPLAVIPTGTANDYARASDLPHDPEDACALAATGSELRPMELGRLADGRPFVNVASAGLASAAARRAEPFKSFLGPLAYPVGALRAAATEQPLALHGLRGRRARSSTARRGRRSSPSPARSAAAPRSTPPTPTTACSTPRSSPPARASASPAAPGACAAARSPSSATSATRAARVVEVDLPPGTEFNVDGEVQDCRLERVTVEHRAYELVIG